MTTRARLAEELSGARQELAEAEARCRDFELDGMRLLKVASRLEDEIRSALDHAEARCRALDVETEALRDAVAGLHRRLLAEAGPRRRHLDDERRSTTAKITIAGLDLYVTVGVYEDDLPGELFVSANGGWDHSMRAMLDQWAIAVSIALQWGADGRNLFTKFARQRFEPSGPASAQLGFASSPVDAISRWVLRKFYPEAEHAADQG